MYKKNLLIGAVIILLIFGCKKPPTSVTNISEVSTNPTTIDEVQSVLGGVYADYRSQNLSGFQLLCKTFACSEHTADLEYGGDASWSELTYNHLSSTNSYVFQTWSGLYEGVKDANAALASAESFQKNYGSSGDTTQINYILGQAYFLRAYYYFQLECFFGEKYIDITQPVANDADILGVPLITSIPQTLAQTQQPRATARQVWNQITNDLTTAATLLHGVSWSGNDLGRATDWAAKGLLGKAYVFTQNWDSAAIVLKDVIQNSGKSLMPYSQYVQAFNDNVYPGVLNSNQPQKFNEESLFEIEVDRGSTGYGIFEAAPNLNLTTSMGLIWAPSGFSEGGNSRDLALTMGYSNEFVHDKNLLRFGFTLPVNSLDTGTLVPNQNYNAYSTTVYTTHSIPSASYIEASDSFRVNKVADPRLYVCALQPYLDTVYFKYPDNDQGVSLLRPVSKNNNLYGLSTLGDGLQAWSFKKYQTLDASLLDVEESDGANYYLLRLADIYLLYAEARYHIGGNTDGEGLTYLNLVHNRAYNNDALALANGKPGHSYTSFTDRTIAASVDNNLANNPLAYERYAELFAEGHWWFDVCRWGNSITAGGQPDNVFPYNSSFGDFEASYYGPLLPSASAINPIGVPSEWSDNVNGIYSYCFPIPLQEIEANSQLSAQSVSPYTHGGQSYGY